MYILGISAFYHDSAAVLLHDGKIVAAAQEERFSRKRHDERFPTNAIEYCLRKACIEAQHINIVSFYDKPLLKFERLLETYVAFAPRGFTSFRMAVPIWLREKLFLKDLICKEMKKFAPNINWEPMLRFSEHHLSHAASAFYPSPFEEAAVLTMDGVGEWATTTLAIGKGNNISIIKEIHFPHSLGLLYSAFTYYTGFKVNSGEYKLMGLAPYGEPKYTQLIFDYLVDVKEDGSFRLDQSYFNYCTGLTMTSPKFHKLFGGPPRTPEEKIEQHHMDMAASIQQALEIIVTKLARDIVQSTGQKNLCLAGGVALNCVANGKLLNEKIFENIWIQPAAGDAGGALGAAQAVHYLHHNQPRKVETTDSMQGSYLGPDYDQHEIEEFLTKAGATFSVLNDADLLMASATALTEGKALGWFQGRMEFGPRALGARSILGDARSPTMQSILNLKVKFRESFRPFAPSVLKEDAADWFKIDGDSPYMLLVCNVAEKRCRAMTNVEEALFGIEKLNIVRSEIPAVTHIDYSARVQTVDAKTNPRYHALLSTFKEKTGCPVLANTSFNVRGEPIVCTPEDAFRCFMGTEIDVLAIGNCFLKKEEQNPDLKIKYAHRFELD